MFAVIAPALMTGAFADRMLFRPYLVYIFCWVHLVYFPFCHWVWGRGPCTPSLFSSTSGCFVRETTGS